MDENRDLEAERDELLQRIESSLKGPIGELMDQVISQLPEQSEVVLLTNGEGSGYADQG